MRTSFPIACVIALATVENAHAVNVAVIATPPGILSILILLFACASAVVCYQVFSVVKGGLLGKSWQLFLGAFAVLALTQVATLLNSMEIVAVPVWLVPASIGLMVAMFFFGVFEAKRVLG
ncbi:MAG: hypothetical protein JSU65_07845 [Candidatus Zixiibacteriota bacterium]|nr:MAG: hypothetical protein JSU65_07845 [candidate division Zixibacteria bacterium]